MTENLIGVLSSQEKELIEKKKELRNRIRLIQSMRKNDNPPPTDIRKEKRQIRKFLFEAPEFKKAGTILFYASLDGEVWTKELIKNALRLGKRIALPKVSGKKLLLHEITSLHQLEKSDLGIPEPKDRPEIPLKEIELMIVPGLAFDSSGNRLGRGGGYYDRLLSEANEKIPKIALAFEFQIVEHVPSGINDQKVDKIITENGTIDCQRPTKEERCKK